MNLQQLQYFMAVAEEGSFTRAAERCHVSQSGLSAQIQRLERELGAMLFDRTTRTVALTPAGRAALGPARDALLGVTGLQAAVNGVLGILRGHLSVAMVTACTVSPLFDALASFHQAHPSVTVSLSESDSARMVEQIRDGVVDVALIGCAGGPPEDLGSMVIIQEGLVAIARDDQPVAQSASLTLAELAAHSLVCLPRGTGIRAVLDQARDGQASAFTVPLEASAPDTVVDLTRRGLGLGVLSASMAPREPGLVSIPIEGITVPATLAIIWKTSTANPALKSFLKMCESSFHPGHL